MHKNRFSTSTHVHTLYCILLISFAAGSASAAGLGNNAQFAVEMKMMSSMGATAGQSATTKFYVGIDRIRTEVSMQGMPEGGGSITVFDGDQATMYMLIPQMKQYMKQVGTAEDYANEGLGPVFGSPDDPQHPCQSDPETSCEKIGPDTILGRSVDKYLVNDMDDGEPTESVIWVDRELLFPLKVESDEGFMEATSLEFGAQPDALFEVPAGYSEMESDY
jgi:hypothetical protein